MPPEPDPRETRARRTHAHMRGFARIYLALVIVSGAALVALAFYAPWVPVKALASVISATLVIVTLASFVSNATDGLVSGFGVAWGGHAGSACACAFPGDSPNHAQAPRPATETVIAP